MHPPDAGVRSGPSAAGRESVGGFMWTAMAYGSQALGQIVVLGLLARHLDEVQFGLVSAALVVIGLVRILTDAIVGPALTQRPDLRAEHISTAFALSVAIGLVAGGLLWLSADLVAGLFSMPTLAPVVAALSVVFIVQALGMVPLSLLQRERAFRRLAMVEATAFFVGYAMVGVILAMRGFGVWALVAAQIGYALLLTVLLLTSNRPRFCRLSIKAATDILYFGGGHTLGRLFNYVALKGDYFVVGRWMSAASLGIYGRAYQLGLDPAVPLGHALDKVLFPVMASMQDDLGRLRRAFRRTITLAAAVSAPVSALGFILGPELVRVVLGEGWEAAIAPFQVLVLGLLFRTGYKPSDTLARATGNVYQRAWRQAVYAVLVIGAALLGSQWGLTTVAILVVGAIIVNYLMMASLSLRLLSMGWREFASAHLRGLTLAGAVTAVALPVAEVLRSGGAGLLGVVGGSIGACLIAGAVAVWMQPDRVLGPDIQWLLASLRRRRDVRGMP